MTLEEYQNAKKEIELKARLELNKIAKEYALSNSPAQVGNIVRDHIGNCLVTSISFTISNGIPSCIYSGPMLTLSGNLFKSKKVRQVYQSNLLKKDIKEPK